MRCVRPRVLPIFNERILLLRAQLSFRLIGWTISNIKALEIRSDEKLTSMVGHTPELSPSERESSQGMRNKSFDVSED